MELTHGSLFSGIGGFDLAAHWCEIKTLWQVEKDPYCQEVLRQHFPGSRLYEDIKKINIEALQKVAIISGGFPCQPFSHAGKRKGKDDDRYLWPETLKIIEEVRPAYFIGENVPGIISLALDDVLASLEKQGYFTETFILPACAMGAWHKRDRVWIIAMLKDRFGGGSPSEIRTRWKKVEKQIALLSNTDGWGWQEPGPFGKCSNKKEDKTWETASIADGCLSNIWQSEPKVDRVANGIPKRVDRIKALGNAIVPQLAFIIFKAIIELEQVIEQTGK